MRETYSKRIRHWESAYLKAWLDSRIYEYEVAGFARIILWVSKSEIRTRVLVHHSIDVIRMHLYDLGKKQWKGSAGNNRISAWLKIIHSSIFLCHILVLSLYKICTRLFTKLVLQLPFRAAITMVSIKTPSPSVPLRNKILTFSWQIQIVSPECIIIRP